MTELDQHLSRLMQTKETTAETKFRKLRAQADELERALENNLHHILNASQSSSYLNEGEKAVLHWSADYARKALILFDEQRFSLRFLFWIRLLVIQRLGSFLGHKNSGQLYELLKLQDQHKEAYISRLNEELARLAGKSQELTESYLRLLIAKENKDSAYELGTIDSPKELMHRFLATATLITKFKIETKVKEAYSQKIGRLTGHSIKTMHPSKKSYRQS